MTTAELKELESIKSRKILLEESDQELPKPDNFATPEELYKELERAVLKYHPSDDLSMIRTAGIGIAMGNANESLKAEAAHITTSVDDNGILNALRHFKLI